MEECRRSLSVPGRQASDRQVSEMQVTRNVKVYIQNIIGIVHIVENSYQIPIVNNGIHWDRTNSFLIDCVPHIKPKRDGFAHTGITQLPVRLRRSSVAQFVYYCMLIKLFYLKLFPYDQ